jgi:hypothetical protein
MSTAHSQSHHAYIEAGGKLQELLGCVSVLHLRRAARTSAQNTVRASMPEAREGEGAGDCMRLCCNLQLWGSSPDAQQRVHNRIRPERETHTQIVFGEHAGNIEVLCK